jgi:multidrug resistance efflux pump
VIAGTATVVSGAVIDSKTRSAQQKAAAQQAAADAHQAQIDASVQRALVNQEMSQGPVPQAAAVPTQSTDDKLAQLQRLGELHQSGILSDEEFAAMKANILR